MAKKLNVWIRKNPLTPDPTDYIAVPVTIGSIGIDGIVDKLQKEGIELKRETVIDVVTRFNRMLFSPQSRKSDLKCNKSCITEKIKKMEYVPINRFK